MKKFIYRLIAAIVCVVLIIPSYVQARKANVWENPYSDVNSSMWSYRYIRDLGIAGILQSAETLSPYEVQTRSGFVSYLYAIHQKLGGKRVQPQNVFEDVSNSHPDYEPVFWAYKNGIVNGTGANAFAPDAPLTREHICTILMRYTDFAGIKLELQNDAAQFVDSLQISSYARSPVVACQMAGIVNGYDSGYFKPHNHITREETLAVVWRLYHCATVPAKQGVLYVNTMPGAYDGLYEQFDPIPDPVVPAGETVDLSYFDKTVFVGDSVSLRLQYYCAATKALGNAHFLCAGSLSATNALFPVGKDSVHPSYQGKKVLVEDGVAASGAEIVYIMLGINNISFGVENATADMVTLIDRILEKSPNVKIIIQSVTPMSANSTIISQRLNNDNIARYNQKMKEICIERGWYYLNVSEAVCDEMGNLKAEYCSDNNEMGIHFTNAAGQVWVEYLKTHVPDQLK